MTRSGNRTMLALAAVLIVSLGWAAWISRPSVHNDAQAASVWKLEPKDLRRLTLEEGGTKVVIDVTPASGPDFPMLWVQSQSAGTAAAGGRPPTPPVSEAFKGGAQAWTLLKQLAQLEATRRVGKADKVNLADLGLATPAGQLTLEVQGDPAPHQLKLGAMPYGNVARYVQADGQVYLIGATPLRQLTAGTQLLDREWSPFPVQDARRLIVRQGRRSASLWKLDLPPAEPNRWARQPNASAGDAALQEFVSALLQLKVQSYRSPGKKFDPAQPELEVQMFRAAEANPEVWLRIYPGDALQQPGQSSYTGRPVVFPAASARQVLTRGQAILTKP